MLALYNSFPLTRDFLSIGCFYCFFFLFLKTFQFAASINRLNFHHTINLNINKSQKYDVVEHYVKSSCLLLISYSMVSSLNTHVYSFLVHQRHDFFDSLAWIIRINLVNVLRWLCSPLSFGLLGCCAWIFVYRLGLLGDLELCSWFKDGFTNFFGIVL